MSTIKDALHKKREITEKHIKELEQKEKQGIRYTAMMPDVPFLILGLLSDIGWILHLIVGIIYLCKNGFHHILDYLTLLSMIGIIFGVGYLIYLNKIHEKEIATKYQKNFSFGITIYSGLFGAIIGILQIAIYSTISVEFLLIIIGGFLNFVSGLPIFLSFKKGIFYGVK